jgi:hypothetical protein
VKTYLGGGLYAEYDANGRQVVLTAVRVGLQVSNTVYLDAEVLTVFLDYARAARACRAETDDEAKP